MAVPFVNYFPRTGVQPILPAQPIDGQVGQLGFANQVGQLGSAFSQPHVSVPGSSGQAQQLGLLQAVGQVSSGSPVQYSQPGGPSGGDEAFGALLRSLQGQAGVLPQGFGGGPVTQGPGPATAPPPSAVVPAVAGAPVPWAVGAKQGGILNPFTGIHVGPHLSAVSGSGHARAARPAVPVAPPASFAQWFGAHQTQAQNAQHPLVQLLQGLFGQQAPTA